MSSCFFLNLAHPQTGLCNQLNSLMTAICLCFNKEKIIVIDNFLKEVHTNNFCPIAEIINLEETNRFLKKYNVALVDANFAHNLNIISATYGKNDTFIDVTHKIKQFLNNNSFSISNTININHLFDNFLLGESDKQIKIEFILNNYNTFSLSFSVNNLFLNNEININFSNKNYINAFEWTLIEHENFVNMTNDIYKNLIFCDQFIINSNLFLSRNNIRKEDRINIIHIRIEQDAIDFWGKHNKEMFINKLVKFYIDSIRELIGRNDKTIILSYELNNCIVQFLNDNNYKYYYYEKDKNQNRECNAIIDIINGKSCNNVFIGAGGSTFSHTLLKLISPKKIRMIELNNI